MIVLIPFVDQIEFGGLFTVKDMETLWEDTCRLLREEMSEISYRTWVEDNLTPARVDGDVLLVVITMENMRSIIQSKYSNLFSSCLSQAAGTPMTFSIVTRSELDRVETEPEPGDPHLNPKYTFENFVIGSGNRFAHAAAVAVAESPAEAYNPLFIYGGVGLGKTHLMQAIGNYIHEQQPDKKILYITSENFTNDLIDAIQQKKTYEFRDRIRTVDILMVDDVQFIAGRESTQQEFFNTFNELHNAGKQIILTSDKPPKDIAHLEERLCSRFEWGLVADIQRPDMDTRIAILKEKARLENINLSNDVLQLIAGNIDTNIRELEGCLKRLLAYASLNRTSYDNIDVDLCEQALKEIFDQRRHKQITAELIMQTTCDYYNMSLSDLTGPTRKREITIPRQIAMFLTREMTGMSLPQIGTVFGGRDHTTVMHSIKTVEVGVRSNPNMEEIVNDIRHMVKDAR